MAFDLNEFEMQLPNEIKGKSDCLPFTILDCWHFKYYSNQNVIGTHSNVFVIKGEQNKKKKRKILHFLYLPRIPSI